MGAMNLFVLFTIAALSPGVLGHGWMAEPPARQLPECNSASGEPQQVISGGGTGGGVSGLTLGGTPEVCGDPFIPKTEGFRSNFKDLPCQAERTEYEEGGVLDMSWMITANHGGFFQCNICDDPNNLSQECFDKYQLLTTSHNSERWYIMTPESSRVHDAENADKPRGHMFQWGWHLPAGLTCEHCVVQCTWWSATHCTFPCEREVCGWYADGYNHIMRPPGASNYKRVTDICPSMTPPPGEAPQMFRSCGDIKIVGSDGGAPASAPEAGAMAAPEEAEPVVEVPGAAMVDEADGEEVMAGQPETAPETDAELEQEEEEMEVATFSPAGNMLSCDDSKVASVIRNINKRRTNNNASPVECSERATGTAEGWSEAMCAEGVASNDQANNCALANMGEDCTEMVTICGAATPLRDMSGEDMTSLRTTAFSSVGVGYYACEDGQTAWTLLFK